MANCSFSISFSTSAGDIKAKAEAAIVKAEGTFTGDDKSGNFSVPTPVGKITGTYIMGASAIDIKITDKPFLVGCKMIEDKLTAYINPVV
jgi:hypothetical protein